jgi:hypothetical protein
MQGHSEMCGGRERMILGLGDAAGGFGAGREDCGHGRLVGRVSGGFGQTN